MRGRDWFDIPDGFDITAAEAALSQASPTEACDMLSQATVRQRRPSGRSDRAAITQRRRRLWAYLSDIYPEHVPYREIMRELGYPDGSTDKFVRDVRALEAMGYVRGPGYRHAPIAVLVPFVHGWLKEGRE